MRNFIGLVCGAFAGFVALVLDGSVAEAYIAFLIGYLSGMKFAEEEDA